jgi:hypothetical protein
MKRANEIEFSKGIRNLKKPGFGFHYHFIHRSDGRQRFAGEGARFTFLASIQFSLFLQSILLTLLLN